MKVLKIFEDFVMDEVNLEYVKTKMVELSELANDSLTTMEADKMNSKFEYSINDEYPDGMVLQIDLTIDGHLLEITFQLDRLYMGIYSNIKHTYWTGNVDSFDSGMRRIELIINDHLGVQERKLHN